MAPLVNIASRISGATTTVVLGKERLKEIYDAWRDHGRRVELSDAIDLLKWSGIKLGKKSGNSWDLIDLKDKYERRVINAVLRQSRSDDSVRIQEIRYVEEKPVEINHPEPSKQLKLF